MKDQHPQIYLDNNATTRPAPEVVEAMLPYLTDFYGNASSVHAAGLKADEAVAAARKRLAKLLGILPEHIFFTSGGTEGNNTLLKGLARARRKRGRHIISTAIEHASVNGPLRQLEEEGFEITRLHPENGTISAEQVLEAVQHDETILVSIMHVNNETGAILPVGEIATRLKAEHPDVLVHSDGVQAFGKLDVGGLEVDAYTISGHKIHAPKGVGACVLKQPQWLHPLLVGGGQERNLRSGTENIPGIVALGEASRLAYEHKGEADVLLRKLNERFRKGLAQLEDTFVNTPDAAVPSTLNVSFVPVPGEVMVNALSDEGIFVSSGSACSSGSGARSHVLQAMGLSDDRVESSVRFSMSRYSEERDIDRTLEVINEVLPRLKKMAKIQRA